MGDALAIALLEARGFTAEDFAFSHPSGALGRKLLLKTGDLMHSGGQLPRVAGDLPLKNALLEMTAKGLGITCVVDDQDALLGVFTDGDLRRVIDQNLDVNKISIGDVMNSKPTTIAAESLAAQALGLMEDRKITALVVVDAAGHAAGVIHMHDILRAGVI
jgi:arabinose-5-phosphate isomerase